jgi:hypothetical protein
MIQGSTRADGQRDGEGRGACLPGLNTLDDARQFADKIGIAPGMVVGRLQHDSLWPYSRGNQLKRPLSFPAAADECGRTLTCRPESAQLGSRHLLPGL